MKRLLTTLAFAFTAWIMHAQSCPDNNHPHAIDLGLPSGTKWACCNVGADTPEGYGGIYAWGETEEKENYDWDTYKNIDSSTDEFQYLGSDIAGTQYDVAHVQWGDNWVMPSYDQIWEMVNTCSSAWTSVNNINGGLFTGPNGSSIFLLSAGYRWTDLLYYVNIYGGYWTSTQDISDLHYAYILGFHWGNSDWYDSCNRSNGISVRPVISTTDNINHPASSSDVSGHAVYSIFGIKVADNTDNINSLTPGIYIVNGKKKVICY